MNSAVLKICELKLFSINKVLAIHLLLYCTISSQNTCVVVCIEARIMLIK